MALPSSSDFLITDPLAQDNVVDAIPPDVELVDLDDIPYRAEPQVHCAFCKVRRLHNDGYFAILSNGQRAPCGNCCAAKFDAVKKQTIDKSRNRLKRERERRVRALELAEDVPEQTQQLELIAHTQSLVELSRVVLREVLTEDARHDLRNNGIQGIEFLEGCRARLDFARATFRALLKMSSASEKEFEGQLERKRIAQGELRTAAEYHTACEAFFAPNNLAALETWAINHGRRFGVRQLKIKGAKLHAKGPTLWQNLDIPEIDSLERLSPLCAPVAAHEGGSALMASDKPGRD